MAAVCGSLKRSWCPIAVLGMFDVSARPFVSGDILSFAVPVHKFIKMVENISENFLKTKSLRNVQMRIK